MADQLLVDRCPRGIRLWRGWIRLRRRWNEPVRRSRATYPPSSHAASTSVAALMAGTPTSTVTSMSSGFTPGKLTLTVTLSPSQTMSNGIDQSRRPEASDASVLALFSEENDGNPAQRRLARRRGHLISYMGSQRVNTISNLLLNAC